MIRARRARIVATLGPASRAPGTVKALAQAGADVGASRVLLPNPTADFALGGIALGRTNPAAAFRPLIVS